MFNTCEVVWIVSGAVVIATSAAEQLAGLTPRASKEPVPALTARLNTKEERTPRPPVACLIVYVASLLTRAGEQIGR